MTLHYKLNYFSKYLKQILLSKCNIEIESLLFCPSVSLINNLKYIFTKSFGILIMQEFVTLQNLLILPLARGYFNDSNNLFSLS